MALPAAAQKDGPLLPMALVTTVPKVFRQGGSVYTVPTGQVVRLLELPTITSFQPPPGHKLVQAGNLKVGDTAT